MLVPADLDLDSCSFILIVVRNRTIGSWLVVFSVVVDIVIVYIDSVIPLMTGASFFFHVCEDDDRDEGEDNNEHSQTARTTKHFASLARGALLDSFDAMAANSHDEPSDNAFEEGVPHEYFLEVLVGCLHLVHVGDYDHRDDASNSLEQSYRLTEFKICLRNGNSMQKIEHEE